MKKVLKKLIKVVGISFGVMMAGILVFGIVYEMTASPEEKAADEARWAEEERQSEIAQAEEQAKQEKLLQEQAAQSALQKEKEDAMYSLVEASIQDLISTGLIARIDSEFNEIYVNPAKWNNATIKGKEITAQALFTYCQRACEFKNYVIIKDNYSGKDLAKYGLTGFKVY